MNQTALKNKQIEYVLEYLIYLIIFRNKIILIIFLS